MWLIELRKKIWDLLLLLGLAAVTTGLLAFPSEMVEAAKSGVNLCFNVLIPSLFPFFVLASLTVELGLAERLGRLVGPVMRPLFNVGGPCASALVLGFVGGYPIGAKTVISLYNNRQCTKAEAERMLAFCNNSSPAFIFGVVGAGLFASGRVGLLLYLAHIAASLCVGLLFRRWGDSHIAKPSECSSAPHPAFSEAFVKSVTSSFSSSLNICGFVLFFTVLIRLLFLSGVMSAVSGALGVVFSFFGLSENLAEALLTGLVELTSGVWSLREASGTLTASIAMASFMLGWAGLSVHCQVMSFLASTGLSVHPYLLGKLLHGVLSTLFVLLLSRVIRLPEPVSLVLAKQVSRLSNLRFFSTFKLSVMLAVSLGIVFMLLSRFSSKTGGKKRDEAL